MTAGTTVRHRTAAIAATLAANAVVRLDLTMLNVEEVGDGRAA
jgi:hypothetical protein